MLKPQRNVTFKVTQPSLNCCITFLVCKSRAMWQVAWNFIDRSCLKGVIWKICQIQSLKRNNIPKHLVKFHGDWLWHFKMEGELLWSMFFTNQASQSLLHWLETSLLVPFGTSEPKNSIQLLLTAKGKKTCPALFPALLVRKPPSLFLTPPHSGEKSSIHMWCCTKTEQSWKNYVNVF